MSEDNNQKYLHVQRRRIEHDKWCCGCGLKRDPGSVYIMDWIKKYAAQFRDAWNKSLCSGCRNYKECGLLVLRECDRYDPYNESGRK